MKKFLFLFGFILLFFNVVQAQYNSENLSLASNKDVISLDKLQLYPIRANNTFKEAHKDLGKYTSLKDALATKKIKIVETESGGTVNTLIAQNMSNETIYLLAGEIVKGGKQDRVLGKDVVLEPFEKTDLNAFCVEQGRWSEGNTGSEFQGYYNVGAADVRKAAVVKKNQQEVWAEVGKTTAKHRAASSSGTYVALESSEDYNKELQRYLRKFSSAWDNDINVIGVVAVTGNRIIGADLFANHNLFVQHYNNLLHSYITEAISNGETVSIGRTDVLKYLNAFLGDENVQEEQVNSNGSMFEHEGRKLHITTF